MGAYLRTDTDLILMASTDKDAALEKGAVVGRRENAQAENDRDAENEALDLQRLANQALKDMKNKSVRPEDSMSKSPSTEILENYNQQPLHVRSRAEQWELPRAVRSRNLNIVIFFDDLQTNLRCGYVRSNTGNSAHR